MSVEELNAAVDDLFAALDDEALALWVEIGNRLLKGQKDYGGFKFAEYDLDRMAVEEIMDFVVYRAAKEYLKRGK